MAKMVFVVSFDIPEDDARVGEVVEDVLGVVQPLFLEQPNVMVWAGIRNSAESVLNVIGVD